MILGYLFGFFSIIDLIGWWWYTRWCFVGKRDYFLTLSPQNTKMDFFCLITNTIKSYIYRSGSFFKILITTTKADAFCVEAVVSRRTRIIDSRFVCKYTACWHFLRSLQSSAYEIGCPHMWIYTESWGCSIDVQRRFNAIVTCDMLL